MFYEWKVCNTSEIQKYKFPELDKTIYLDNYYDQAYRIWETENAVTLYQPSLRVFYLPKTGGDLEILFGENDYLRMVLQSDGTYDIYHGQNA